MFGLGWQELLLILIVLLILFGGKRLPELARGLGSGIKEFKKALREDESAQGENLMISSIIGENLAIAPGLK